MDVKNLCERLSSLSGTNVTPGNFSRAKISWLPELEPGRIYKAELLIDLSISHSRIKTNILKKGTIVNVMCLINERLEISYAQCKIGDAPKNSVRLLSD